MGWCPADRVAGPAARPRLSASRSAASARLPAAPGYPPPGGHTRRRRPATRRPAGLPAAAARLPAARRAYPPPPPGYPPPEPMWQPPPAYPLAPDAYPVNVSYDRAARINRLWGIPVLGYLVRAILLIPHFILLWLLVIVAALLTS